MKYLYLLILPLLVVYTLVLIYIYINQRNLLYHPEENNYLDDKIEFNYEEIQIKTDKNIKLTSWLIKKDFKNYRGELSMGMSNDYEIALDYGATIIRIGTKIFI